MVITRSFQCLLTIAGEKDKRTLLMRCDEKSLKNAIELIDAKLYQENYEEALNFRNAIKNLGNPIEANVQQAYCSESEYSTISVHKFELLIVPRFC